MTAIAIRRTDGCDEISQHPLDRLCRLREDIELRRNTFQEWPAHKQELATALCENGFYYFGVSDKVQCVYCGGVLCNWTSNDEVCTQHVRHFGHCEFARKKAVNALTTMAAHVEHENIQPKHNQCVNFNARNIDAHVEHVILQPKYQQFVDVNSRLLSFTSWPNIMKQRPKELAEAGLFYTEPQETDLSTCRIAGTSDKCKCYMCGLVLSEWEEGDVPQTEHNKWNPKCPLSR